MIAAAAPVLAAQLALSTTKAAVGTAATIAIIGATVGSAISGAVPDGMKLDSAARTISGAPTTAGDYSVILAETLEGASNSPHSSTVTITVATATVALAALTLSATTATAGTAATIAIAGATSGSTITGAVPAGMTLSSAARTITGAPTTAGTYTFTLTETLAGASNSPRVSTVTITVAAAAATAVTPIADTSWRVQPSAVTVAGSTGDAAYGATLLASKANNDYPAVQIAANTTATVTWTVPAIASPGAIIPYTTSSGSQASRTVTVAKSTDGGTTWTAIAHTPAQTVSGTNNNDQIVELPACNAGDLIRLTYANAQASTHFVRLGLYQLQSDPARNPLFFISGMSITLTNTQTGAVRDQFVAAFPAMDPVFTTIARSGATPANYLTEQLQGVAQARSFVHYVLQDWGVNDFVSGTNLAWGSRTAADQNATIAAVQATLAWGTKHGRVMVVLNSPFVDPSTYNGVSYTINQEGVSETGADVSVANQDLGIRSYTTNAYVPNLPANSVDAATKLPKFDGYAATLYAWGLYFGNRTSGKGDGVHPVNPGGEVYRIAFVDAAAAMMGVSRAHFLRRRIDDWTLTGASAAQINRLHLVNNALDPAMDAATRADWRARIAAIPTSYQEPAGQSAPAGLTGMVASFDFDDIATLWQDDARSVAALDRDLIHVVDNKVAAIGGKLINATAVAVPYKQPQFRTSQINGRGGLILDGTNTALTSADAAIVTPFQPAAQPFIIGWTMAPGATLLKRYWELKVGATTYLYARTGAANAAATQIATNAAVLGTDTTTAGGGAAVFVLTYDGTTLKLRRNGVETLSVAWAKPAVAYDTLAIGGGNGIAGAALGLHLLAGTWTTATRDALEARMRAKAGV